MPTNSQLIRSLLLSAISLTLLGAAPGDAADLSKADPMTKLAFGLFKQGKVKEAGELQVIATRNNPNDWLAHEALAYFSWLQGDVVQATAEAKKASMLAPEQAIAFTNLGQIYEHVYEYRNAIPEYERATKIAPDAWEPWIGLARAFVLNNNPGDAYAVLHRMESQKDQSFDWYYQIGRTYLYMDKPESAVEPLSRAKSVATTKQQKSDAAIQHLMALLRSNQKPRVRTTAEEVFSKYHPEDHELYIRAAYSLIPPVEPVSGQRFLKISTTNLTSAKDSDLFFRLGRIFEDKANTISYDADASTKWLSNAESAYRHAIALDATRASYHLALAGILDRQFKSEEVAGELTKAQSLDSSDKLTPFLLSASKDRSPNFSLNEVQFTLNGVGCGCKINLIEHALRQVSGVTLVSIAHDKPYQGTMLIDQSVTKAPDALLQALKTVFPFDYKDTSHAPTLSGEIHSSQPIKSTAAAVVVSRTIKDGALLQFAKPQMRSTLGSLRFELAEVAHDKARAGQSM